MKKQFAAICLVVLMLPTCLSVARANEGYTLSARNFMPDHILGMLSEQFSISGEQKPVFLIDHDPTQGKVEYVSWISYDTLSEISLGWKTSSVVVFNSTMNAYFLRVSYMPTISEDGQLKYCALGTSNGFCYGSKATEKSEINIDNSVTINKSTVIQNPYIQSVIGMAGKTADSVTAGMKNIIDWLDLQVDATMLVNKRLDVTNKILFWIAENFNDMMYAIGQADLLIAEVGIYQLEQLVRIQDYLDATNQNQIATYYAMNSFFYDVVDRLDNVISNGALQVNTSSIDARLDKLISMYSKVNSVVLDTAAINGSKIKAAVGGELEDAIFWGNSGYSNNAFIVSGATYSLNGVQAKIPVRLRGFSLGASVPASFDTTDTSLMAGVWRISGGNYRLSDTYNAATGEYVRRVGAVTYDGSEDWKMVTKDGCYLFYLSDPAFSHTNGNIFSVASGFGYVPYNSAFSGNTSDSAIAYNYKFTVFTGKVMVICQSPSVAAWKTWLKQQVAAGTPWTVWYQDVPTATVLDRTTIAVPEGDSTITGDYMRITGKYETYDSYTQTADIIAAVNGIPSFDDSAVVGAIANLENALSKPSATVTTDLTEVTSRLDVLIENSASKIENTTVNITEDNDAFNVFYITGEDGETQPITEFAKDLSGASGKFLSVLYRLVFSDALNSADSDLGSLEDFFTSTEPEEDITTQSADGIDEEVDIWSTF